MNIKEPCILQHCGWLCSMCAKNTKLYLYFDTCFGNTTRVYPNTHLNPIQARFTAPTTTSSRKMLLRTHPRNVDQRARPYSHIFISGRGIVGRTPARTTLRRAQMETKCRREEGPVPSALNGPWRPREYLKVSTDEAIDAASPARILSRSSVRCV